jgi:hypothetical protein
MSKLDELISKFENDKSWNTPESNGGRRFDKDLIWIRGMIESYSKKLNIPIDEVVESFEKNRDYSWPNYYQKANFPDLDRIEDVSVYETLEDFKHENKRFKCPACGNVYGHPVLCEHRIKKDGICDWTAGGLFTFGLHHVVIKSNSLVPIGIFPPVKEEANE